MNRDDIIRLAREADPGFEADPHLGESLVGMEAIERFAALVAEREREECAKLCETYETASIRHEAPSTAMIFNHCAKAIRARGETK